QFRRGLRCARSHHRGGPRKMIPRTPHLTQGHDPALAAQIAKTRPGMAHWSGSGPLGRTCAGCAHLGHLRQARNAYGVAVATEPRRVWARFLELTGRHGPIVPKRAKHVGTSSRGTTPQRANATRTHLRVIAMLRENSP